MTLYEVYIRLCNEKGKTPSSAAVEMGLSKAMVSRWKKGSTPSDATIIKIADYFGLTLEELRKMEAEQKKPAAQEEEQYYLTDDARDLAQFLFENPEYKVLFDGVRKVRKEDLEVIKALLEKFS